MTNLEIPDKAVASRFDVIPAGECMYRCHTLDFAGTDFNPGVGQAGRFTPLIQSTGQAIPTLYAAETFDAAVYETLFRKEASPESYVPINKVKAFGVSQILVRCELSMVELFTPELRRWDVEESALFSPCIDSYGACRVLAARIWRDNPSACGLMWRSNQDSKSNAYLLFGGRCSGDDLIVQQIHSIDSDKDYLDQIADVAYRAGIKLV